ncbi:MAG TPA: MBL fold metallo-hydrolase [Chloroflexota bacterium]|nr:MBL fold metallo-hydrolase [Chloroflexota bacterium]
MPGLEDELGDVVKKARAGRGMELGQLAERAGLTEREAKALEVYTFTPNERQVRALAAALGLRADQLWSLAQDSWSAPDVPRRIGERYTVEWLTNHYPEHCYVVSAPDGTCLVIDPGAEPEPIIATATLGGRRVEAILITHRHQDHTGATAEVQKATSAPVYVHREDVEGVAAVAERAVKTFGDDGELLRGAVSVRTLHTPGHTPGSVTYVISDGGATAAFCGDTLFAGSAGNARAGYDVLLRSLRKLASLPADTVLYPGHGPQTTLANELEKNPFL